MTAFADALKKEVARVARKELRDEMAAIRKTFALQRSDIAALKKQLRGAQAQIKALGKAQAASARRSPDATNAAEGIPPKGKQGRKAAFSAERLKANRARLGFTQQQMAKLLGVSSLSIWKWESGGAEPRATRVPQILKQLALGKREAVAIVEPEPH